MYSEWVTETFEYIDFDEMRFIVSHESPCSESRQEKKYSRTKRNLTGYQNNVTIGHIFGFKLHTKNNLVTLQVSQESHLQKLITFS